MNLSNFFWYIRSFIGKLKAYILEVNFKVPISIDMSVKFSFPKKIEIDTNCEIRENCFFNGRTNSRYGIKIGANCRIKDSVTLDSYGGKIEIGDKVLLGRNTTIYGHGGIKIGKNTMIGPNVLIVSSNHIFSLTIQAFQEQGYTKEKIEIGEDIWIGGNVTVLGSSIIENRVVVSAGSIVRGTLKSGYVYGGNPIKIIKPIPKNIDLSKDIYYKNWQGVYNNEI